MKKKVKISVFVLISLIAIFFLIKFQAKRIIIELIEANALDRVEVKLGRIKINPLNSSLELHDVMVLVRDNNSDNYKKATIKRVFLDVASLWDFYQGGTLIIEESIFKEAELTIFNDTRAQTSSHSFALSEVIEKIKHDAIRFQIKDIWFDDFNLILKSDTLSTPTTISHLSARIRDLYLSADSVLNRKPLVELSLPVQSIEFSNGLHVGFDSLFFSTSDNSVQLNKFELISPPGDEFNSYQVHSDKVRLAQFSFESFFTKGTLVVDSIFFGKSNVLVNWKVSKGKHHQNTHTEIPALPRMDIRNIDFKEIAADVMIRSEASENTFKVQQASLTIDNFIHRPDSARVIYAPNYNLLIVKYATFLGNDHSSIRFDTIQIQKHSLSLLNFKFNTEEQVQPIVQTPKFELNNVDWYELLVNRKLVAYEASVFNPKLIASINPGLNKESKVTGDLVSSLSNFLKVKLFTLKNATAFIKMVDKHMDITLRGYTTSVRVEDLISSTSANEVMNAIQELSVRSLNLTHPDFNAQVDNFRLGQQLTSIGNVNYRSLNTVAFNLSGLSLGKIDWNETYNTLSLSGLGWQSLIAEVNEFEKSKSQSRSNFIMPAIRINNIRGESTEARYSKSELILHSLLTQLHLKEFIFDDSLQFTGLEVNGNSLTLSLKPNEIEVGPFYITDQGGVANGIHFSRQANDIDVQVGQLSFAANLPDFVRQKFLLSKLDLNTIEARFNKKDSTQFLHVELKSNLTASNINYINHELLMDTLSFAIGPFDFLTEQQVKNKGYDESIASYSDTRKFRTVLDTLMQRRYPVKGIQHTEREHRLARSRNLDTATYSKKTTHIHSRFGGLKLNFSHVETKNFDSTTQINAIVDSILLNQIAVATDKLNATISEGSLSSLVINSDHFNNPWKIIEDNRASAGIHNVKAKIEFNGNRIQFGGLDYNPVDASGLVSQFEFRPLKEKQPFLDENYYQTNYMQARIEAIAFSRLNINRFLSDTAFHFATMRVVLPNLDLARDKTHPFFATAVKPLPTNAFQKLKVKFRIDTLDVWNGKITYTEKSRVTGRDGTIHFDELGALIRNIKNIDLHHNDSLNIMATTRFMDSARVKMRVRESYRDSLGGFVLTTQVSPFHTSILNPALIPMVSVEFKSGFVDTLLMKAVGREYLSLGSMKFLYRDLKVNFLDRYDTSIHSLKSQLMKFAVNTFVIRANNTQRKGTVFYERDRNRAVFQYWVKMILSGVTTSVGAKSNKKQLKRYLKELDQKKLPRIKDNLEL